MEKITRVAQFEIVKDGKAYVSTVRLELDIESLMRDLGGKAARNISGRAVEAGGLVSAKRMQVIEKVGG